MKSTNTTEFGKYLRALRAKRDEKQEDTANILGCTKSYLSTVELGKQPIPSGWVEKIILAYELNDQDSNKLRSLALDITKIVKIDTENLSPDKKHLVISMAGKIEHMQDHITDEFNELLLKVEGHDMSAMEGWETHEFRLLVGDGSSVTRSNPKSMFVYFIGYKGEDGELVDCRYNPKKICLVSDSEKEDAETLRKWSKIEPHSVIKVRAIVNNIRGLVDSRSFNSELLETGLEIKNDEKKLFDKYLSQMILKGSFGEVVFSRVKWWFRGMVNFHGHEVDVRIDRRIDGEKYFGAVYDSLESMTQKFKETLSERLLESGAWYFNSEKVEIKDILAEIKLIKIRSVSEYGYNADFEFRDIHIAGTFVNFSERSNIKIAGFYMGLNNGLEPI